MSNDHQRIKFITKDEKQRKFFTTLTKRINKHFKDKNLSKKANTEMITKSVIMLSAYILPFLAFLYFQPNIWGTSGIFSIMGFAVAGIGMTVMHDAIHGAYSHKNWINKMMGYSLNLLGGARINWYYQHNLLHHTYTNIIEWDEDINGKGTIKLEPTKETKPFHRFQWIYAFFFYSILTLYWMLLKDFVQFYKYTKSGLNKRTRLQNLSIVGQITAHKIVYFSVFLALPTLVFGIPFIYALSGFLLMHFIAGLVLTIIFQLAHSVEGTEHPLPDENGNIDNAWAIHQMETTMNFARGNRFLNWYLGGLNYQVEHHLFPQICHVHYPQIAPIVKKTAREFDVPYKETATFREALNKHVSLLKRYGELPSADEAIV